MLIILIDIKDKEKFSTNVIINDIDNFCENIGINLMIVCLLMI